MTCTGFLFCFHPSPNKSHRVGAGGVVQRHLDFYSLDAILSVGYRVKSAVATRFRIWATQRLREYIVKGFVLDDERLKNPDQPFDYFEELMRRIQDIRTSERRFYLEITDIYQQFPVTDMGRILFGPA